MVNLFDIYDIKNKEFHRTIFKNKCENGYVIIGFKYEIFSPEEIAYYICKIMNDEEKYFTTISPNKIREKYKDCEYITAMISFNWVGEISISAGPRELIEAAKVYCDAVYIFDNKQQIEYILGIGDK